MKVKLLLPLLRNHIYIPLLNDNKYCSDEPIESNSEWEEIRGYSNHNRHHIEHHLLHECWIQRHFRCSFCFLDFFRFLFCYRIICERELCLYPLDESKGESKENPDGSTDMLKIKPVEERDYACWIK